MVKHSLINSLIFLILCISLIPSTNSLLSQCGIKFCSSCDPNSKFCNQCELPYKPGYNNQSVCTRCANNCAVCQSQGIDSKGKCLSCLPHFDYSKDDHCDTFEIWIYVVVIASYIAFIVVIFLVFCYIKKRKQKQNSLWFQKLKSNLNKVDTQKITVLQFQKMCQYLLELLKQSSSYNNLKFRDRQYQKAMKIKKVELKTIGTQTHMKQIKISGYDNSQWEGHGYVFIPKDDKSKLKLWFAKNYIKKVFSQHISKIIIYESQSIETNQIKGKWYFYGNPEISGDWKGIKQMIDQRIQQQIYMES